jgi:hypothetical protein
MLDKVACFPGEKSPHADAHDVYPFNGTARFS